MVAIIGRADVQESISQLNYSNSFETISLTPESALKAIEEAQGQISHLIYDISVIGAIDKSLSYLERLKITASGTKIIVVAAEFDKSNVFIKDIQDITNLIAFDSAAGLRSLVARVLVKDGVISRNIEQSGPAETEPQYLPSQISKKEAVEAARLTKYRRPGPTIADIISVIGTEHKVGTTTQALQTALYLKAIGYRVGVVEMVKSDLLFYADEENRKEHFQVSGLDIFDSPDNLPKIRQDYDYLILDCGTTKDSDLSSVALQGYTVIIVCGSKYYEIEAVNKVLEQDTRGFNYVFSHTGPTARQEILESMEDLADRTYFAEYSPDLFFYCGNDTLYGRLTGVIDDSPRQPVIQKRFKLPFGGIRWKRKS